MLVSYQHYIVPQLHLEQILRSGWSPVQEVSCAQEKLKDFFFFCHVPLGAPWVIIIEDYTNLILHSVCALFASIIEK